MNDLSVCPGCGGEADNGHDRCVPPNVYLCSKCQSLPTRNPWDDAEYIRQKEEQERKAKRAELVREFMRSVAAGYGSQPVHLAFEDGARWVRELAVALADDYLKWEGEQ